LSSNRGIRAADTPAVNPKSAELHRNARLLLSDAVALGERATPGQFLLFRQAIELALKSFLHQRGDSLKNLRLEFACDLEGLLRRARDRGLAAETVDTRIISELGRYTELAIVRCNFSAAGPFLADIRPAATSLVEAARRARE